MIIINVIIIAIITIITIIAIIARVINFKDKCTRTSKGKKLKNWSRLVHECIYVLCKIFLE